MTPNETHILLIEGKSAASQSLRHYLTKIWSSVTIAHTGAEAIKRSSLKLPQIIVFDASTMRSNGVRTCKRLRQKLAEVPLIHVRAENKKESPEIGADVYLQRPFTARKLNNRVKILLPAADVGDQVLEVGNITLYRTKRAVVINGGREHPLTPKLSSLLDEFMSHPNEVLSRKELMERVWKTSYVGDTRTLDVHIRWIREIIEDNPKKPKRLTTVRGVGYMLQSEPLE